MNVSALQFWIQNWPGSDPQDYRAHLGKYGISGDLALQPIDTLSGGQKSRVAFAMMGWLKPHFLVLDEPTNHLDVETVDILARALNEFAGGIILVSHDERLITSVCNGARPRHPPPPHFCAFSPFFNCNFGYYFYFYFHIFIL